MKRALWLLVLAGIVVFGAGCHKKDHAAKPAKKEHVAKEKKVKTHKIHKHEKKTAETKVAVM